MSGGSMDYLCYKVQDATFYEHTQLRKIFRAHLNLVAEALHDIEWVDSCDYGDGRENKAILAVLNHDPSEYLRKMLEEDINNKQKQLKALEDDESES